VFATLDGRVKVVECALAHALIPCHHQSCYALVFVFLRFGLVRRYSEISPEAAAATDADGQLVFNAGNICNHVYTTACLHSFSTAAIPYHVAHKKIPVADAEGNTKAPPSNNGIKLER
jgi:hypothetical protein